MLPDQCVLVSASLDVEDTVVSETLGDEPEKQEPCLVSLCSTTPDEDYSLDSDEIRPMRRIVLYARSGKDRTGSGPTCTARTTHGRNDESIRIIGY
eukprot:357791-Pyramimonas_sp.AAC.1